WLSSTLQSQLSNPQAVWLRQSVRNSSRAILCSTDGQVKIPPSQAGDQVRAQTMFTLYYAPNTCALATHIALLDAGAKYELKRVDFSKSEQQSPEYLAINPKGRVPAMVTPRGILTETPALLVFVA